MKTCCGWILRVWKDALFGFLSSVLTFDALYMCRLFTYPWLMEGSGAGDNLDLFGDVHIYLVKVFLYELRKCGVNWISKLGVHPWLL